MLLMMHTVTDRLDALYSVHVRKADGSGRLRLARLFNQTAQVVGPCTRATYMTLNAHPHLHGRPAREYHRHLLPLADHAHRRFHGLLETLGHQLPHAHHSNQADHGRLHPQDDQLHQANRSHHRDQVGLEVP